MRALVLSGGGAHGAYQVGVLKALSERSEEDYQLVCGISVGALNAAFLAQYKVGDMGKAVSDLAAFWRSLNTGKIYRKRTFGLLSALWNPSVFDSSPLQSMVRGMYDGERIRASGRSMRVGAVCWETGEYRSVDENTDPLVEWILASSSYPAFFSPVQIDGLNWSDGGLRNVTPISDAFECGARHVDAIVCENTAQRSLVRREAEHHRLLRARVFRGDEGACTKRSAGRWRNEQVREGRCSVRSVLRAGHRA
jgi:NTE family protein